MISASQYVIKDIHRSLKKNPEETRKLINKFSNRYPNDMGLQYIQKLFYSYLEDPDRQRLERLKKNLEALMQSRRLESHGGIDYLLWLRDRRPRCEMCLHIR